MIKLPMAGNHMHAQSRRSTSKLSSHSRHAPLHLLQPLLRRLHLLLLAAVELRQLGLKEVKVAHAVHVLAVQHLCMEGGGQSGSGWDQLLHTWRLLDVLAGPAACHTAECT